MGVVFYVLFQLAIDYPAIGIPLLIVAVIVFVVISKNKAKLQNDWTAGAAQRRVGVVDEKARARAVERAASAARKLDELRNFDPNWSQVLFEDFLYALYAEVQRARGLGELEAMSAYLAASARGSLIRPPGMTEVRGVIVGALHVRDVNGVSQGSAGANVRVAFESNYVEVVGGRETTFYVEEEWSLFRKLGVASRTPARSRTIDCPKCGAPLSSSTLRGGTCSYCGTQVGTGDFDWLVTAITVARKEPRGPQLTTDMPEVGTEWPTVVDPQAKERFATLCQRDPSFTWPGFEARVKTIHRELNAGWSALDWTRVRPYVTDNLFQMQTYWIEAYRAQKLRNRVDDARVLVVEVAKVVQDRFFDALTVRVHATGLDYVEREGGGGLVRGSDTEERRYTEYWTLIRGVGTRGPARSDPACPKCGAALKVNMAGSCEYCHAKVTTGEFDWVLSRIEQDESYGG